MNEKIEKILKNSELEISKKIHIISSLRLLENLKKLGISEGFIVEQIQDELKNILN